MMEPDSRVPPGAEPGGADVVQRRRSREGSTRADGPSLRRVAVGSAVLGLVTLCSGLGWAAVVSHEAAGLTARTLDTRAAAIEAAAAAEIGRYTDTVSLAAAALGSVDRVDAAAFESVAAPLGSMDLAGATSLAFLTPPVTDQDVAATQARWRARGATGLELDPVETERTHVFAVLSEPLDGSGLRRTGVDVAGAPAPYAALGQSRRTGAVALSAAYELIIDQDLPESERQTSFSVTAPVVREGRLVGWVLMGLRGQDFLGGVLASAAEGRVDVELEATDTAGADLTVAAVDAAARGARTLSDQQRRSVTIRAAQQTWTLEVFADTPALIGAIRHRPLAIQVISVVVALLVGGLAWAVGSGRARSRAEIRTATRDLATAEEAARSQADLLHTVVETVDDVGVGVVDAHGQVLVLSRAARRILGVDVEPGSGVPGRWLRDLGLLDLGGAPFAERDMPLVRALAGESTDDVEMVVRNRAHPHGVHLVVSGRPLDLGGGRAGALAVFRDVTAERRQQAAQSAFNGMVAHDLKNPLGLVRGFLELADDEVDRLEGPTDVVGTVHTFLGRASAASERMAGLIDDLLAYTTATDSTLVITEVDLGSLVRDTLADVVAGHLAERRSSGATATPPLVHVGDLPVVRGDEARLRQVVANLVGNALKYVEPGARAVLDVVAEVDDRGVRVFVADRGIGIPEDERDDVVKPFVRTSRTSTLAGEAGGYPGTGLGLAICQRILERHGGSLALRGNPGGGTVAVVDLPTVTTDPPEPRPTPGSASVVVTDSDQAVV